MPPPVANPIRDRAVELGKKMGCRGVVEALKREGHVVGKSAVAEWMRAGKARQAGEHAGEQASGKAKKPRPVKGATHTPPAKPAKGRPAVPARSKSPAEEGQAPWRDEAELADIDPGAMDFAELVKLDEEVTAFLRRAHKDEDERRYAVLARLKLDVRVALEKLRPAPKVDPDKDPMALAARDAVFSKLKKMVANAKAAAAPSPPEGAP